MDNRKVVRKKKRLFLKIDGENRGVLVDISKLGLRAALENFPSGEAVDISFRVKQKIFDLKGTIHWVEIKQTLDKEPFEMGVSLVEPGSDYIRFVEKIPETTNDGSD